MRSLFGPLVPIASGGDSNLRMLCELENMLYKLSKVCEEAKDEGSDVGSIRDQSLGISSFSRDLGFDEISPSVLEKNHWSIVWSRFWKFESNILNTEASALTWSIEHLLRSKRNICERLVCLSATKGRGIPSIC